MDKYDSPAWETVVWPPHTAGKVRTFSSLNGIRLFNKIDEAKAHAEEDSYVYRIGYTTKGNAIASYIKTPQGWKPEKKRRLENEDVPVVPKEIEEAQ
jgi:hypothetical protein